ncbi:MAG: type II toxin-antitoxin system death-on-curing family toxin [Balneolaceae bacterium]|nr:type II toxin-antitoxin system death-on-curing family toxin [Balneolaceae bacterium]
MIRFLNKETILLFHDHQIETYGGSRGIRDEGLLESALALPQQSFGGEFVHKTIFEMAAAYGFHLCKNHPFIDGNKRTALVAMFTFLHVNGWRINAEKKLLYSVIIDLASGKLDKKELASLLEKQSVRIQ